MYQKFALELPLARQEEGKKASSQSFMWVVRSATSEPVTASFFYYSKTRSGDVAKELLKDFNGYLITDAYAGYEKVQNIKRGLCWSHCHRYFVDSIWIHPEKRFQARKVQ